MLLKQYLVKQGLALESGEALAPVESDKAIQASIDEVVAHSDKVDEAHAEIETADEAVQTLESMVVAFESAVGERTALEKHLFVSHATTLYAQMGLAKPAQMALESADYVTLSMEGFKETAKKVGDAIKAAWDKLVAMFKDLWAKLGDAAGKMHKKLSAKLKETTKTEVSFKVSITSPGADTITDAELGTVFTKTDTKETIEFTNGLTHKLIGLVRNSDFDGVEKAVKEIEAGFKKEEAERKEITFNLSTGKAGLAILNQLNQMSKYQRDWAGRQARKEALMKELTAAFSKSAEDAGSSSPQWFIRMAARGLMKATRYEERILSVQSVLNIRVANAFMAEL